MFERMKLRQRILLGYLAPLLLLLGVWACVHQSAKGRRGHRWRATIRSG